MEALRKEILHWAPLCLKDRKPFLCKSIVIERTLAGLDTTIPQLH